MSHIPYDRQTAYDQPIGWWGYNRIPPEPRSLVWLIREGTLTEQAAAFLSLAVEGRRSLIVVAEPHQAGKTTVLTALLDFLPPDTQPVYLRGVYERFTFRDEVPAERAYVLCNEISAHLPTYLWGRGVRSVFQALVDGYPLATTMHAESGDDALQRLCQFPLDVPEADVVHLDLIVSLGMDYVDNRLVRRVTRVERVRRQNGPPGTELLAERTPLRAELQNFTGRMVRALGDWYGVTDEEASRLLAGRERLLRSWQQRGILGADAVRKAFVTHRNQESPDT